MTRVERQTEFSEKLNAWLKANVGPLTVAEVVGIIQVHCITMTMDAHYPSGRDDDGEDWKE